MTNFSLITDDALPRDYGYSDEIERFRRRELDFSSQACLLSQGRRKFIPRQHRDPSLWRKKIPQLTSDRWAGKGWSCPHLDLHEERPYATIELMWSEPGLWQQREAHFLVVKIQHVGQASVPINWVTVDFNLAQVVQTVNDHMYARSAKGATLCVGLYGPCQVRGLPRGQTEVASPEEVNGAEYDHEFADPEERFVYTSTLQQVQTVPEGSRVSPEDDDWVMDGTSNGCYHGVAATIRERMVCNRAYREDAPDVTIGVIVLTNGEPFMLCARTDCDVMLGTIELLPCENPARFTPAAPALIPEGQSALGPVFDPDSVKAKIRELCSWTDPYQSIFFAFEDGHLEP